MACLFHSGSATRKGLGFGVNYTWSKNLADFVDNLTGGSTPADAYNYSLEKSYSPFDTTHRFVSFATYELPWGLGRPWLNQGVAARILGGWQLNGIVTLQTGTPFTVTAPDRSQTGGSHASRPDLIGDPFAGATQSDSAFVGNAPGFWINPAAFALPAVGTFGNVAPRAFHGPGMRNFDLSLFKSFAFTESIRLEFRTEFFNAFNNVNFNNPNSSFNPANTASFGRVFSTVTDPRSIQFALKLYF